ncbi:MAG: hypothetical protein IK013_03025 [Bacteroidales bacterium]|nr:hypothetical protein [Bacteroidales bacterium]
MSNFELLSVVVAGLAILVSIYSLVLSDKTRKRNLQMSFFSEYTRRYQEIEMGLMSDDSQKNDLYCRLYFDLCSEEFYLKSKDCLPTDVWQMWLDGMKMMTKKELLQVKWKMYSQYYNDDFASFFGNLIKENNNK